MSKRGNIGGCVFICFLTLSVLIPVIAHAADLVIGSSVTTAGDWTLTGAMSATSFSGNGSGLTNLHYDTTVVQSRVTGTCTSGNAMRQINQDGTVICEPIGVGGDITAVTAGSGLTGGGTSGDVTLDVDFAGTGSAATAARSDHNHDTLYQQKYDNVAVVAQSGGDYTDPVTAMNDYATWCGTPSSGNPCLLKIMPGIYDIGTSMLTMQAYIDIEGSGENVTVIQGNYDGSTDYGLLNGASNAELRFITVKNSGGGTYAFAINNYGASPKLTNVTAVASGGTSDTVAVHNQYGASAIMTNVTATATGSAQVTAVVNYQCTSNMTNVTAIATGGTTTRAVINHGSFSDSTVMQNVIATATGGTSNYGVWNGSASATMMGVTASASGGTESYGVWIADTGTVKINHSVIRGATNTIYNGSGVTTLVGNTQLDGGTVSNAGTLTCAGVYDETYAFSASTCP
jgi:hypothetical protein